MCIRKFKKHCFRQIFWGSQKSQEIVLSSLTPGVDANYSCGGGCCYCDNDDDGCNGGVCGSGGCDSVDGFSSNYVGKWLR